MAGLADALYAQAGYNNPPAGGDVLYAPQQSVPTPEMMQQFSPGNSFTQGLARGGRGLRGQIGALVGTGAEAMGFPSVAQGGYDLAADMAHQNADAAQTDAIPTWKNVHDLKGLSQFTLGSVGAGLPYIAPAVLGPMGARIAGAGLEGQIAAGTAANALPFAGSAAERLHDDPATASMPASHRLGIAGTEGLAGAGLYAIPGALMGERAVGAAGMAAKPTLNPLKSAAGMAGDTAAFMGGMGAAGAATGQLGRTVQRQYDPTYLEGQDPELMKEEFAGSAAGMLPFAIPHAISAHTAGAARQPIREFVSAGVKNVGRKIYDSMPDMAQSALDVLVATGKTTSDGARLLSEFKEHIKGKARTALDAYEDSLNTARTDNFITGEEGGVNDHLGAAADAVKAALPTEDEAAATGLAAGRAVRKAAVDTWGTIRKAVFGEGVPEATPMNIKRVHARIASLENVSAEEAPGVYSKLVESLGDHDSPAADRIRTLAQKRLNDGKLSDEEVYGMSNDILEVAAARRAIQQARDIASSKPDATVDEEGPASESSNSIPNKLFRDSFAKWGVDPALTSELGKYVNPTTVHKYGITDLNRQLVAKAAELTGGDEGHMTAVTKAVESMTSELQSYRKEAHPDLPDDPMKVMRGIESAARTMVNASDRPEARDPSTARAAADTMMEIVNAAAQGRDVHYGDGKTRSWRASVGKLTDWLHGEYGQAGAEFVQNVLAHAREAYGENSKVVGRLKLLNDTSTQYESSLRDFGEQLNRKYADQKVNVRNVMKRMLGDLRTTRDMAEPSTLAQHKATLDSNIKQTRAAIDSMENSGTIDPRVQKDIDAKYAELHSYLRQADELAEQRTSPAKDPQMELRRRWLGEFKNDKAYQRALAAVQRYERSGADAVPKKELGGAPTRAATNAEGDTGNHNYSAEQSTTEGAEHLEEDQKKLVAQAANEKGTNDTFTPSQNVGYHGVETMRGLRVEGNDVPTPISRKQSADFEKGGMRNKTYEQMHALHGFHTASEWRNMKNWAEERSASTGESVNSLLNTAMEKVIAHDEERLQTLEKRNASNVASEDIAFLHARREMYDDLKKRGNDAGGTFSPGKLFFEDKINRHYGLYRMEGDEGTELHFTPESLQRFAPKEGVLGPESPDKYANKLMERFKGVKMAPEKRGELIDNIKQSLLPLRFEDGKTTQLDIGRLVENVLERHWVQQGKIIGVKEREGALEHDRTGVPKQRYTSEEVLRAFYEVVNTIKLTKGVDNESAFGEGKPLEGQRLVKATRTGAALFTKKDTARTIREFDPKLVIYRSKPTVVDGNVTQRVVRAGDVVSFLGKDSSGNAMYSRKNIDLNKVLVDRKKETFSESRITKSTGYSKDGTFIGVGKPDEHAAVTPNTHAIEAAKKGVLRDFTAGKDLDLRAALNESADMHGISRSDIPDMDEAHVAALIRDVLINVADTGHKHDLMADDIGKLLAGTKFPRGDPRKAWQDAVVYTRELADGTKFDVTLMALLKKADYGDSMPRHSIEAAKAFHLRSQIDRILRRIDTPENDEGPVGHDVEKVKADIATTNSEIARLTEQRKTAPTNAAQIGIPSRKRAESREQIDEKLAGLKADKTRLEGIRFSSGKDVEDNTVLGRLQSRLDRETGNREESVNTAALKNGMDELYNFMTGSAMRDAKDSDGNYVLADLHDVLGTGNEVPKMGAAEAKRALGAGEKYAGVDKTGPKMADVKDSGKIGPATDWTSPENLRKLSTGLRAVEDAFKAAPEAKMTSETLSTVQPVRGPKGSTTGMMEQRRANIASAAAKQKQKEVARLQRMARGEITQTQSGFRSRNNKVGPASKEAAARLAKATEVMNNPRDLSEPVPQAVEHAADASFVEKERESTATGYKQPGVLHVSESNFLAHLDQYTPEQAANWIASNSPRSQTDKMVLKDYVNSILDEIHSRDPEKAVKASYELVDTGGWKEPVSKADDAPFSESSRKTKPLTNEEKIAQLEKDLTEGLSKIFPKEIMKGVKLVDKIEGNDKAIGKLVDQIAQIHIGAMDKGEVRWHEGWHGLEQFLKKQIGGTEILATVYKHVGSERMSQWFAEQYANDPGALKQMDKLGDSEKAAFAFQKIMEGATLPGSPVVRGFWNTIKSWIQKLGNLIGIGNEGKHTQAFFDYVKNSNLLRDHDNPDAMLNALHRTTMDEFASDVRSFTEPLHGGLSALLGHSSNRMHDTGIAAYQTIANLYAGESGKGGYISKQNAAINRFGNELDRIAELEDKGVQGARIRDLQGKLSGYLNKAGFTNGEINRMYDGILAFDQEKINSGIKEFMTDVVNHAGTSGKNGAELRVIAQNIADTGFFYDPMIGRELFKDPKVAAKWTVTDPTERMARMIYQGTRMAERRRAFGANDENLKLLVEAGDAEATPEQRLFAEQFVASYEGKLGNGTMSPAARKMMGVLITANNIRMLPMAVFSQLLEPMQLAFRKNSFSGTFDAMWRGISDMPRSFDSINKRYKDDPSGYRDYWERISAEMGTIGSDIVGSAVANMTNGMNLHGMTKRINNMFFKYNLMEQWNRSMHVAATKMAVEFLRDHSTLPDGAQSERFLKELGLTPEDIKFDGEDRIIVNSKIEDAVNQFVNEAMAHPDAGSNPIWMNDPRFALLAQMKRFTFAHSRYVLERGIREFKLGNKFVMAPAILSVPWMMTADSIRDMVNPTSDRSYMKNWTYTDHVIHGIERTGSFGRWSFPLDVEKSISAGGSGMEGLLGPTAELFSRVGRGAHEGNMMDAMLGNLPGAPLLMPD